MTSVFKALILQWGFRWVLAELVDAVDELVYEQVDRSGLESMGTKIENHRYTRYNLALRQLLEEVRKEDDR